MAHFPVGGEMKVKIFSALNEETLQDLVNTFLKENRYFDLQYRINPDPDGYSFFSVLIVYQEGK